jgi:hypothetical protein
VCGFSQLVLQVAARAGDLFPVHKQNDSPVMKGKKLFSRVTQQNWLYPHHVFFSSHNLGAI